LAGGQNYAVWYEAKKTRRSKGGEEGGQEGRQQPQEGGTAAGSIGIAKCSELPNSARDPPFGSQHALRVKWTPDLGPGD
jgi:hypothetical protein